MDMLLYFFLTQNHNGLECQMLLPPAVFVRYQRHLTRAVLNMGEYRLLLFLAIGQVFDKKCGTFWNFNMGNYSKNSLNATRKYKRKYLHSLMYMYIVFWINCIPLVVTAENKKNTKNKKYHGSQWKNPKIWNILTSPDHRVNGWKFGTRGPWNCICRAFFHIWFFKFSLGSFWCTS